jgi:hypothetical protein
MILRGFIAPILRINLLPDPIATKLDLTQGIDNTRVAGVFERANDADGYVVTFSSTSKRLLRANQRNNTDNMPLTLNHAGGGAFSLSNDPVSLSHKARTDAEGVTQRLGPGIPTHWVAADPYEDTVTTTISAL